VQLLSRVGCRIPDLIAAIGPHISVARFEVSEEVALELSGVVPGLQVVERGHGPKPHVNLRRLVRAQLITLGLTSAAIDDVLGCTVGDDVAFFSYRRDGRVSGRHLSAIVARAPEF
jgi:copper oxidase (laccase) domain-containing protein